MYIHMPRVRFLLLMCVLYAFYAFYAFRLCLVLYFPQSRPLQDVAFRSDVATAINTYMA